MLDLRKHTQTYRGFYIWKRPERGIWEVGKNGTSNHTTFPIGKHAKVDIITYINATL